MEQAQAEKAACKANAKTEGYCRATAEVHSPRHRGHAVSKAKTTKSSRNPTGQSAAARQTRKDQPNRRAATEAQHRGFGGCCGCRGCVGGCCKTGCSYDHIGQWVRFGIDAGVRTVGASGQLRLEPNQRRSRSAQTNAGKPDRRPSDHGGHFIAREFGGPEIPANHFAQDAKVNRGQYRKLELTWKKALKREQEVDVDIVAKYKGNSKRPHSLDVKYIIDGKIVRKTIPNIKGEK